LTPSGVITVIENPSFFAVDTLVIVRENEGEDNDEAILALSAIVDDGEYIIPTVSPDGGPGASTIPDNNNFNLTLEDNGDITFASGINVSGNATFVSSINVSGAAVVDGNATFGRTINVSGDVNGMPYPPPYAHIRMNATGVNSDDQYNFASSCGNMYTTSSNSSHFNWNDTDKELDVSAAGEYEVNLTAAAQTDTTNNQVTCRVKLDGVLQTAITYRINTATDPHPISISWVGPVTSGESITVTIDGTENTQLMLGSAITVKRVS